MKKLFFIFGMLLLTINSANALNAPELRCVQVNADGTVTLTWAAPTEPSNFKEYICESSPDGATFTEFGRITSVGTLTTTHSVDANADATSEIYYRIKAVSDAGITLTSNILSTMVFQLSVQDLGGTALLQWKSPGDGLPSSHAKSYEIHAQNYWESTFSKMSNVDYVSNAETFLNHKETITFCNGVKQYQIKLEDTQSKCFNVSRILSNDFTIYFDPAAPILDSVSVNYATGKTRLSWQPSSSGNVVSYIIYHESGAYYPVDTVSTTWWIDSDPARDPSNKSQRYTVAALDSCDKGSVQTDNQATIHVTYQSLDPCTQSCEISWTEYVNMKGGVEEYEIYYAVDDGALRHAGTVPASTQSYKLENLIPTKNYNIIVKAVNRTNGISASSSICKFTFQIEDAENVVSIRNTTVTNNEHITISATLNGDIHPFTELLLYRSEKDFVNRKLIAKVPYNKQVEYVYVDKNVNVQKYEYYYNIELTNDCGAVVAASNEMHNILLQGRADRDLYRNYVEWAEFGDWENGVFNYGLYRKLQTEPLAKLLSENTPSDLLLYWDIEVADLYTLGSDFSYYVEAISNPDNDGNSDTSRSNTLVLKQMQKTFIPNAFRPDGTYNTVFKPVNSYVDITTYVFAIYSRNGQLIFQTTDPNEGWDGTFEGKPAPLGVYVYYVTYVFPNGEFYKRPGTVTLVK